MNLKHKVGNEVVRIILDSCHESSGYDYRGMKTKAYKFNEGAQYQIARDIVNHVIDRMKIDENQCVQEADPQWFEESCTCHMGHPPCSYCTSPEREARP